jgi:fatty acid desaturase
MSVQAVLPLIAARGEEFRDDVRKRLPPEVLARYTAISAWRSTLALAQTLALLALLIAAGIMWWHPLALVPIVLLIGVQQHALFVLAHDAAHYRLYDARWLNDLVGRAVGTVAGISMCTYRVIHRLHHNHLYQAQDPDTALHGGYPRGKAYLWKKLAIDVSGFTAWKTYAYFFGAPALNADTGRAQRPLDDTSPRLRQQAQADRRGVIIFHLSAFALAFYFGYCVEYFVLWLLPLATVIQAILRLRAVCEHGAVTDFSSPLTAARTNLVARPLGALLFPHHVNYHIEHHLYPAVPHYYLPQLHAELLRHGILEGAEVVPVARTLSKIFAARLPAAA